MYTHDKIETYLHVTGMPATLFGRLAVRDPRLVGDLRRGRRLRTATAARIEVFLATTQAEHRP